MTAFGSLPQRRLTCHAFNASRTWEGGPKIRLIQVVDFIEPGDLDWALTVC